MRTRANHKVYIDVSIPFDQQKMMERTRAILANFFRDYWAYDKQRAKIEEKDLLSELSR